MKLSDFHYDLPEHLIARYPLPERSASRLLCLNGKNGEIQHKQFTDLISFLKPHDLLVFNNTKVIPARLFGQKASGGKIEMLVERCLDQHRVIAHVRASKSPKPGSIIFFADHIQFEVMGRQDDLFELKCLHEKPVLEVLEKIGEIPLPPYFQRKPEEIDKERYQTVFAKEKGSVAAPTAGLHFDRDFLKKISEQGTDLGFVTLHVGAGTFAPVRTDDITQHKMHAEYLEVSEGLCDQIRNAKMKGGRIIAVGTTSARSLETAALKGLVAPYYGDTQLFIYPGYRVRCVDALITNLHLPGSSLLMLVSALAGYQNIMKAYQQAVEKEYRFFSYGDAMFIEPELG